MNAFSQKSIYGQVYKTILAYGLIKKGDRVIVALSGGPDSMALFSILRELGEKLSMEIIVCHFNHRLRGEASDQDEQFVIKKCHEFGVECIVGRADRKNRYKSENTAREARYSFFEKILEEGRGDSVAIAHNQNDQAETVLMRLIRGTGIRGLKSILYKRQKFIRPLLDISREEIETFLKNEKIPFVVDQSNFSCDYQRNEIRTHLLPYLATINPNILETLTNISKSASVDYNFIEQNSVKAMNDIITESHQDKIYFNYKKWLNLHPALQVMVLRLGLETLVSLDDISVTQIEEAVSVLKKGVGRKYKRLPHSLIIELNDGKIVLSKQ